MNITAKLNYIKKMLGEEEKFQREKKYLFLNLLYH